MLDEMLTTLPTVDPTSCSSSTTQRSPGGGFSTRSPGVLMKIILPEDPSNPQWWSAWAPCCLDSNGIDFVNHDRLVALEAAVASLSAVGERVRSRPRRDRLQSSGSRGTRWRRTPCTSLCTSAETSTRSRRWSTRRSGVERVETLNWVTGERSTSRTDTNRAMQGTELGIAWDNGRSEVQSRPAPRSATLASSPSSRSPSSAGPPACRWAWQARMLRLWSQNHLLGGHIKRMSVRSRRLTSSG